LNWGIEKEGEDEKRIIRGRSEEWWRRKRMNQRRPPLRLEEDEGRNECVIGWKWE
jgi:hypothetical protein